MLHKIAFGSVTMVIGTLYVFFGAVTEQPDDLKRASTLAFTTFVMFQMFNAINCRNYSKSVFEIGWFSNMYLIAACGGSIIMQIFVVYLPFLQYIFETVSLTSSELMYAILVSSSVFLMDEIWKWYGRKHNAININAL